MFSTSTWSHAIADVYFLIISFMNTIIYSSYKEDKQKQMVIQQKNMRKDFFKCQKV
jgi:hypothetical protein